MSIDDEPFGGGPGMVLRPDVVEKALKSMPEQYNKESKKIYLTPSGTILNQEKLGNLSKLEKITILCGRFEGVDQRAIDVLGFEEVSIGNYVLAGGEIAAQVLLEGCIRLIPGVLGHAESVLEESIILSDGRFVAHVMPEPEILDQSANFDDFVPMGSLRSVEISIDDAGFTPNQSTISGRLAIDIQRTINDPEDATIRTWSGAFAAPVIEERLAEKNVQNIVNKLLNTYINREKAYRDIVHSSADEKSFINDSFTIVTPAELTPRKGHIYAIEAAKKLKLIRINI